MEDKVIIADLHIGLEADVIRKGGAVPRVQIKDMIERTKTIGQKYEAEELVIAGDLKHNFDRNLSSEWKEVEEFLKISSELFTKVHIVRGNHDNYLLTIINNGNYNNIEWHEEGFCFKSEEGTILVVHGHKALDYQEEGLLVMGHEHPAFTYRDNLGTNLNIPVFAYIKGYNILILPTFSPLMEGTDILSNDFLSPILKPLSPFSKRDFELYALNDKLTPVF